jgi:two-component system nitrogen regulation response regulator GlnG
MAIILLAEDDTAVRLVLEYALLDAGHELDSVASASAAKEVLSCRRYDLVLADAMLGDGTGMMVADKAAELGIKTVILTGNIYLLPDGTTSRYELLEKPLRPSEVVAAVTRALTT